MEHTSEIQKQYFEFAYQTGSDIWTHIPYRYKAEQLLPKLEPDALILDIGAGRGLWAMKLVQHGFKVLGIDYIQSIVDSVNITIAKEGLSDRARFILGNALDIPFVKNGFAFVSDIGTLQHIHDTDWEQYSNEVHRVLVDGGYYLNISLSKKTQAFMGLKPHESHTGDFIKFGVHYHFFDENEIEEIFDNQFTIIDQQFETYNSPGEPSDDIVLVFTLMQKKNSLNL